MAHQPENRDHRHVIEQKTFISLPQDLLFLILPRLPLNELLRLSKTCRTFNLFIASNPSLWHSITWITPRTVNQFDYDEDEIHPLENFSAFLSSPPPLASFLRVPSFDICSVLKSLCLDDVLISMDFLISLSRRNVVEALRVRGQEAGPNAAYIIRRLLERWKGENSPFFRLLTTQYVPLRTNPFPRLKYLGLMPLNPAVDAELTWRMPSLDRILRVFGTGGTARSHYKYILTTFTGDTTDTDPLAELDSDSAELPTKSPSERVKLDFSKCTQCEWGPSTTPVPTTPLIFTPTQIPCQSCATVSTRCFSCEIDNYCWVCETRTCGDCIPILERTLRDSSGLTAHDMKVPFMVRCFGGIGGRGQNGVCFGCRRKWMCDGCRGFVIEIWETRREVHRIGEWDMRVCGGCGWRVCEGCCGEGGWEGLCVNPDCAEGSGVSTSVVTRFSDLSLA